MATTTGSDVLPRTPARLPPVDWGDSVPPQHTVPGLAVGMGVAVPRYLSSFDEDEGIPQVGRETLVRAVLEWPFRLRPHLLANAKVSALERADYGYGAICSQTADLLASHVVEEGLHIADIGRQEGGLALWPISCQMITS